MDDDKIKELEKRLKKQKAERNYNFFRPVGQIIEHVDTINFTMDKDGTFHFENIGQVNAVTQPKASEKKDVKEEQPEEENKEDWSGCFKFMNEFIRQRVEAVVNSYYQGNAANLALIEITFFDHNLLKKRNAHTALIKALCAWGTIGPFNKEEIKKLMNAMAGKMSDLPNNGYMEWDGTVYVNDKKICQDIGKDLGEEIKYSRKKDK